MNIVILRMHHTSEYRCHLKLMGLSPFFMRRDFQAIISILSRVDMDTDDPIV